MTKLSEYLQTTLAYLQIILLVLVAFLIFMGIFLHFKGKKHRLALIKLQNIVVENVNSNRLKIPEKQLLQIANNYVNQQNKVIHDSVGLLTTTKKPEIFFTRYDLMVDALKKLREIEDCYRFERLPSELLRKVEADYEPAVSLMIDRAYESALESARKLKTAKGAQNKLEKLYNEFAPFRDRIGEDNLSKLDALRELAAQSIQ